MKKILAVITLISVVLLSWTTGASGTSPTVQLTEAEQAYLESLGPITMGVDPDWMPFEYVDAAGNFTGIAADLVALVAERLGIEIELIITADWAETLARSQEGEFLIVPFLNQTAAREEWLVFTEPLFVDSNVFITREEHPFITSPAELVDKTLVLPEGTSMEEFVRRDYPNLNIITTETEMEAFRMVSDRQADMTLRSLIIAAYTIRKEGFFNLKIAGHVPKYTNNLRMGVLKSEPLLRDILNKAIATITPVEREQIVNRHVYIRIEEPFDYRVLLRVLAGIALVVMAILYWTARFKRLSEDRQKLLEEARGARDNLEQIIEFLPDATFVVDASGTITHWNKAMEEMTGVAKEHMLGLSDLAYSIAFYKKRRPILVDYALKGQGTGEMPSSYEFVRAEDGYKYYGEFFIPGLYWGKGAYVLASASRLQDSEGAAVGAIETIRNISDRKQMEERINFEKERYLTTLMSIGDGVISTDRQGNILTLNRVAEELTGWSQDDAYGKAFDEVFHVVDEATRQVMDNPALLVLLTGRAIELEDTPLLVHRDGSERAIAESIAPVRDEQGIVHGAVVVFRDITEKKEEREQIRYLSFHDQLTGLYNRRFFEAELSRLDALRNLPLTLVMLDANGLKLVNDAFGHLAGDEVLKRVAAALKRECRTDDIIARIGGDEFIILLPQTPVSVAEGIARRVVEAVSRERVESVNLSISFGCGAKEQPEEDMMLVFKRAEDDLYRRKLVESTSMRHKTMEVIVKTLHEKSSHEELHGKKVSRLAVALGNALGLSSDEIEEIRIAGLMHDIGKIALDENLMHKSGALSESEWREMRRHPEIGYRILSSVNELASLAEHVLSHHEWWDGSGYPKGLAGEEIPLGGRIIAVVDAYDVMTSHTAYRLKLSQEKALKRLVEGADTQFDRTVVKAFIEKVLGFNLEQFDKGDQA